MILFAVAPKRIGQLDFLIPFIKNFIHDNNKYTPIILFFDKKLFSQFKKNIVLCEIIKKNGYYFFFNIPKLSLINILFRVLIILPFLIFFLIKKNNIIFIYKSIDTIIESKIPKKDTKLNRWLDKMKKQEEAEKKEDFIID